jgi:hypothetical protein
VFPDSSSAAAATRKTRLPPQPSSLQTMRSSSKITPRTTTGGDLLVETWNCLSLDGMLYAGSIDRRIAEVMRRENEVVLD